jgi:hypothetical protein
VSEAQRQHGWFACLKTLPIYESREARERISPCTVFKLQTKTEDNSDALLVTRIAIQPLIYTDVKYCDSNLFVRQLSAYRFGLQRTCCKLRPLSVRETGSAGDPKPIGLLRLLPRTT